MEIVRPGKGEKDASAPRLLNDCESSGATHNRARIFLTDTRSMPDIPVPSPC